MADVVKVLPRMDISSNSPILFPIYSSVSCTFDFFTNDFWYLNFCKEEYLIHKLPFKIPENFIETVLKFTVEEFRTKEQFFFEKCIHFRFYQRIEVYWVGTYAKIQFIWLCCTCWTIMQAMLCVLWMISFLIEIPWTHHQ